MLDFPDAPTIGMEFAPPGAGRSWEWDGTAWTLQSTVADLAAGLTYVSHHVNDLVTDPAQVLAGIRAAITECGEGGTLVFSPRDYNLVGTGAYQVMLAALKGQTWVGNGARLNALDTYDGCWLVSVYADDVTISGFKFSCSATKTGAVGIMLTGCANVSITGNRFTRPRSGGVHGKGDIRRIRIANNTFNGQGYGVLLNDPTGAEATGSFDWVISGNIFDGEGGVGTAIELNRPTYAASNVTIGDNVITNYTKSAETVGSGISVANVSRVTISGNKISTCSRNGIHIEDDSDYVTVVGNVVNGCLHGGIEVQTGTSWSAQEIIIADNVVTGCATTPTVGLGNGGIDVMYVSTDTSSGCKGVAITGNICVGNNGAGIFVNEFQYGVISNNLCRDNIGFGMRLSNPRYSVIANNSCTDSRAGGARTQTYGISATGTTVGALLTGNMLQGNLTGALQDGSDSLWIRHTMPAQDSYQFGNGINKNGFFGATPIVKPTVSGAKGSNAALASLLTQLVALGLIADTTTA